MSHNQQRIEPGETIYIIHYGEVGLKGGNRREFEKKLQSNIKSALKDIGYKQVLRLRGRIAVRPSSDRHQEAVERLQNVPGIVYFTVARVIETDLENMKRVAVERARAAEFRSFAVRASRAYKEFHLDSQEINRILGAEIQEDTGAEVDLEEPDWKLQLEVMKDRTFVYDREVQGVGGLPVGASGRVLSLISGGIDSPVASYLMMKRGCRLGYIHFHSFPLTDRSGQEKAQQVVEHLDRYQRGTVLYMIPFADCQEEIVSAAPAKYRILIYRRFMVRIAEKIAIEHDYRSLVTGESLGQVSSQTLENMASIEAAVDRPILRPVVGLDKQEITRLARDVTDTYEMSIQPHQDCCSYLMPENPVTSSEPLELTDAESDLPVDELVEEAVDQVEKVFFSRQGSND